MEEPVRAYVRVRPVLQHESEGEWRQDGDELSLMFQGFNVEAANRSVFGAGTGTAHVYALSCAPLVARFVDGYSAYVFAYGQTTSGKTHTMSGTVTEPGLIRLTLQDIFANTIVAAALVAGSASLTLSYIEIYNETIIDLLQRAREKTPLDVFYDERRQPSVVVGRFARTATGERVFHPATTVLITSADQALRFVRQGEMSRHYRATQNNNHSSRSHTILRLVLVSFPQNLLLAFPYEREQTLRMPSAEESSAETVSECYLLDLAGSERLDVEEAGANRPETRAINQSLLALEQLVRELTAKPQDSARAFAHVRESALTKLLRPALCGHALTAIICAVSFAASDEMETLNTLEFARRAANIKNRVYRSELVSSEVTAVAVVKLERELRTVRQELHEQKLTTLRLQKITEALEEENKALAARVTKTEGECRWLREQLADCGVNQSLSLAIQQNQAGEEPSDDTKQLRERVRELEQRDAYTHEELCQVQRNAFDLQHELLDHLQKEKTLALQVDDLQSRLHDATDVVALVMLERDEERERSRQLQTENAALQRELQRLRAQQAPVKEDTTTTADPGKAQLERLQESQVNLREQLDRTMAKFADLLTCVRPSTGTALTTPPQAGLHMGG